jgi:hypothetical protein
MLLLQGDGMAFIAPIVFLFKSERKSYEIQNILKAIQTQKSSCAPEIMFLFYFQKKKKNILFMIIGNSSKEASSLQLALSRVSQ